MPAVTLGFEEIEDRLRTVGRRVNLFGAQHIGYLAVSALASAGAALIVAALRSSPEVFSATLLAALVVGFSAILVAPWLIVRGWRDLAMTAALVDRRAGLQDRLATLLAVRQQQPPSRLASLLMADTLALGRRWEPRAIAPRRVPRSIYVLLAALLALGSTNWLSRESPPPAGTMTVGGNAGLQPAAKQSLAGAKLELHPPTTMAQAQADDGASLPDGAASETASGERTSAGNQGSLGDASANSPNIGEPQADPHGQALGQQLQQIIRQAFNAQAMGQPQQLARREQQQSAGGAADRGAAGERGHSPSGRDQERNASGEGHRLKDAHGQQGGATERNGNASQPNQPGDRPSQSGPGGDGGKGSGAGAGSAGGSLLAAQGGHGSSPAGGEPKTFKVTLVSFLQSSSLKPSSEPKSPHGHVSDEGLGVGAHPTTPLSDQQLTDDLVRKPEIPPEFEEIVRRVYSQRPES